MLNVWRLTRREIEVAALIARGDSTKVMCSSLNITKSTLDKHRRLIFGKVGVTNRAEFAMFWATSAQASHPFVWESVSLDLTVGTGDRGVAIMDERVLQVEAGPVSAVTTSARVVVDEDPIAGWRIAVGAPVGVRIRAVVAHLHESRFEFSTPAAAQDRRTLRLSTDMSRSQQRLSGLVVRPSVPVEHAALRVRFTGDTPTEIWHFKNPAPATDLDTHERGERLHANSNGIVGHSFGPLRDRVDAGICWDGAGPQLLVS